MQIVQSKSELRKVLAESPKLENRVFVPTMGALHFGHRTLIETGRKVAGDKGILIVSVFLNPIQFDNPHDLATYPKTFEEDMKLCEEAGVDIVFCPLATEMYDKDSSVLVEERALSEVLCGATRPGHFSGVCTVVAKLFNLVQPTIALFGKKDYQQLAIIRRMVRDLDIPVEIQGVDIVREDDGLAMSSRNKRLNKDQRLLAPQLYQSLQAVKKALHEGVREVASLEKIARELIKLIPGTRIDYITVVDAATLTPVAKIEKKAVIAIAVFFGEVRLIDNLELDI